MIEEAFSLRELQLELQRCVGYEAKPLKKMFFFLLYNNSGNHALFYVDMLSILAENVQYHPWLSNDLGTPLTDHYFSIVE